jgi:hypothetical protein
VRQPFLSAAAFLYFELPVTVYHPFVSITFIWTVAAQPLSSVASHQPTFASSNFIVRYHLSKCKIVSYRTCVIFAVIHFV